MKMDNPTCRTCGVKLHKKNWYQSFKKIQNNLCKKCTDNRNRLWKEENKDRAHTNTVKWRQNHPDRARVANEKQRRKHGMLPFTENRKCGLFLGVHVAERVLHHVFKDVEVMPYGNHGFDFICNRGMKIDVKSSCMYAKNNNVGRWIFYTNKNKIADYFLCLAFDDRERLTPLYAWLVPGAAINYKKGTTISQNTLQKWDDYKIDINKIVTCCNIIKETKY